METLADLSVRDADATGDPDATALRSAGDPGREYDYRRLRTDARKTGNFLAHRGVRAGRTLAVADEPVPEVVLSFLGAALLGAVVQFDPPGAVDARAVVAPSDRVGAVDLPAGGQRIGYGGAPDDPGIAHFEEEMWSENPTFPPPSVAPDDPILAAGDRTASHAAVRSAAGTAAADLDLGPGEAVAVRAPLAIPGTVAAGVVAPLLSGATVLLPDPGDRTRAAGTAAVATGDAPEPKSLDPRDLPVG
jgi:hypothetical protein